MGKGPPGWPGLPRLSAAGVGAEAGRRGAGRWGQGQGGGGSQPLVVGGVPRHCAVPGYAASVGRLLSFVSQLKDER